MTTGATTFCSRFPDAGADDLHSHPAGAVVGLSVKGPTKALREAIAASGFARPAA